MMTGGGKVRLLLSTYRQVCCGCRVAGLQTSARPQLQKHLSKARQKAKEDRRDENYQWSLIIVGRVHTDSDSRDAQK